MASTSHFSVSDVPANRVAVSRPTAPRAAAVLVSREHLARSGGVARAVIVNSGCANACTGDAGLAVAREMAAETAASIGCPAEQVLVASTGGDRVNLPIEKIRKGLPIAVRAASAPIRDRAAAQANHDDRSLSERGAARISIDGRS